MYCYKCGAQNEEIARFCRACGTQLKTDSFTSNSYKKVILVNCGRNKINVIKEIRMLTGAGLAEAKIYLNALPLSSRKVSAKRKPNKSRIPLQPSVLL